MKRTASARILGLVLTAVILLGSFAVPALADDTLEGTVALVSGSTFILTMDNGNSLSLSSAGIPDVALNVGDRISVAYTGNILSTPVATAVTVLEASALQSASGIVTNIETVQGSTVFFVQISGAGTFSFLFDAARTTVTGAEKTIAVGDQVTVTWNGDILSRPAALNVTINAAAPRVTPVPTPMPAEKNDMDPSLIDKSLSGTVTQLKNSKMYIKTSKGKKYSFKITNDTIRQGKYDLKVGCKVTVTYDGYASKQPSAKILKVTHAAPDPTPTPESLRTASGNVESVMGIWIRLDDGHVYTVNSANCSISGAENCQVGSYATFKFYFDGDERVCKKATFNPLIVY